jgi:energy-converting hydrogenase Eha subunit H
LKRGWGIMITFSIALAVDEHFVEVENKSERNKATMVAYKKIEIAKYLSLSKSSYF